MGVQGFQGDPETRIVRGLDLKYEFFSSLPPLPLSHSCTSTSSLSHSTHLSSSQSPHLFLSAMKPAVLDLILNQHLIASWPCDDPMYPFYIPSQATLTYSQPLPTVLVIAFFHFCLPLPSTLVLFCDHIFSLQCPILSPPSHISSIFQLFRHYLNQSVVLQSF